MQRELFGNYFSKQGVENYGRLKLLLKFDFMLVCELMKNAFVFVYVTNVGLKHERKQIKTMVFLAYF